MIKYNLYGSEGCHLCEQALELCMLVIPQTQLEKIDIVDQESVSHESKTLVELYAIHIPVIEKLTLDQVNPETIVHSQKLFWPFTQEQLTLLAHE